MSNIAIFHGTGSTPDDFWFPWLKQQLESLGHDVWVPQLPNADEPNIEEWLPFVLQRRDFLSNDDTILVGHSAGCPLILGLLECVERKIKKSILVSGFAQPLNPEKPEQILQKHYNWEKIQSNVGSLVLINSDNDPWGCDDNAGKYIFDHLGGTLIVRHGEGHMGSKTYNQPYREFGFLLELIVSRSI